MMKKYKWVIIQFLIGTGMSIFLFISCNDNSKVSSPNPSPKPITKTTIIEVHFMDGSYDTLKVKGNYKFDGYDNLSDETGIVASDVQYLKILE